MEFVASLTNEDTGLATDNEDDEDAHEDGNREQDAAPQSSVSEKKATGKKPARSNRRKTAGEVPDVRDGQGPTNKKRRRTMGDPPSTSTRFHTQTLTQFFSKSGDEEDWKLPDSDADSEDSVVVRETPKKSAEHAPSGPTATAGPSTVTPLSRRTKMEIPSSESPATPLLLARYSPAKQASPLVAKSTNLSAPLSTFQSVQKTPRTLVIEDTYSTIHSSPVTPTPKARAREPVQVTPAKRLRFDLPEDKENITPGRTKPKSPRPISRPSSKRQPLREVPDSDQELETDLDEDDDASPTTAWSSQGGKGASRPGEVVAPSDDDDDVQYAVGEETQAVLISSGCQMGNTGTSLDENPDSQDEEPHNYTAGPGEAGEQDETDEIIEQTPASTPTPASAPSSSSSKEVVAATQADNPTQGWTQGLESQRVPLGTIEAIGPISDRSDIIISIYGEHVEKMVTRMKTHEFRDWKIPDSVCRVWIYLTKPAKELRYMCIFGPAQTQGQIHEDGVGNAEFNQGMKKSRFAYEVLQMYELNDPVSYQSMKDHGWPTAPQKLAYVPPAIVGQLTANLRCALWEDRADHDLIPSSDAAADFTTESQELADQIQSDMDHAATQLGPSDHFETIPSSPPPRKPASKATSTPRDKAVFARPAPPKTNSASSSRSLPASQSHIGRASVRPSQATTISQLSSSSPVRTPGTSYRTRFSETASSPATQRHRNSSMRSSQLLSKSQMLPDSLMHGDIQEPPPIIWDSADDASE
jgi:hypothetical protein